MENWVDIRGFEGRYQVSDLGRIKSLERIDSLGRKQGGKILKPKRYTNGYVRCSFRIGPDQFEYMIHRLVAYHFLPIVDQSLDYVNHLNGIKDDNRADNLEWTNRSLNNHHLYRTGLSKKNKPFFAYKDGAIIGEFYSLGDFSRQHGVSKSMVRDVLVGIRNHAKGYTFQYKKK